MSFRKSCPKNLRSIVTEKKIKKGDRVGILEIYDANGLIFSDNLYSIVDN